MGGKKRPKRKPTGESRQDRRRRAAVRLIQYVWISINVVLIFWGIDKLLSGHGNSTTWILILVNVMAIGVALLAGAWLKK